MPQTSVILAERNIENVPRCRHLNAKGHPDPLELAESREWNRRDDKLEKIVVTFNFRPQREARWWLHSLGNHCCFYSLSQNELIFRAWTLRISISCFVGDATGIQTRFIYSKHQTVLSLPTLDIATSSNTWFFCCREIFKGIFAAELACSKLQEQLRLLWNCWLEELSNLWRTDPERQSGAMLSNLSSITTVTAMQ